MKLGSIVGIIFSALVIISGIVLCIIGVSSAEKDDRYLFTHRNEDGTYYIQKIDEGITRLNIDLTDADVVITGSAETSQIEFYNFNPNQYALTTTPNVISFEETQKIDSVSDVWENGINFNGLRYALDPAGYKIDELDKKVVISIGKETDIKIIDVAADASDVKINELDIKGDISLHISKGNVALNNVMSGSVIEIFGNELNTSLEASSSLSFRYSVKSSELKLHNMSATDTQITVDSGRVDYITDSYLDDVFISAVSESGGLLVNSLPHNGPLDNVPEEYTVSIKIKCGSAGINFEYPEKISEDSEETTSDDTEVIE